MEQHLCHGDTSIGPTVQDCRGNFDFTIRFEKVVLSLLPTAIAILLFAWRLCSMDKRQRALIGGRLLACKVVSGINP